MIHVENLTKKYSDITAVNNISLNIEQGGVYGLLGPNGAGKTTLISMLCGLLSPDSGSITVDGLNFQKNDLKIRQMIGFIPQELAIYDYLSAWDNVKFFASLYGLRGKALNQAVSSALEFTGLQDAAKKRVKSFSGGMKRRLNISCGIAHSPEILFMDEPTIGIDPQSRHYILESIKSLGREGQTIIYTTHYMEEAEDICSRIAIIDHGKIIAEGTNEQLQDLVTDISRCVITLKQLHSVDLDELSNVIGIKHVEMIDDRVIIESDRGVDNIGSIVSFFTSQEIEIHNINMEKPSLETVFLSLTGRNLREK